MFERRARPSMAAITGSVSMQTQTPYGLRIIENCMSCPHHESRLFCNLSAPALQRLSAITSAAVYPKGATLFVEGQSPRGVFILCNGKVKISTSSPDGRILILRIAEPGKSSDLPLLFLTSRFRQWPK